MDMNKILDEAIELDASDIQCLEYQEIWYQLKGQKY